VKLSVSKIQTFQRCKLKYYFQHVMGIQVPQSEDQAMGSEGHAVLAEFFRERKWTFPQSKWNWEILKTVVFPVTWKPILVEETLSVPIVLSPNKAIELVGILDLVLQDERGEIWIVDHKFTQSRNLSVAQTYLMGMQGWLYGYLLKLCKNVDPAGFLINWIHLDWRNGTLENLFFRNIFPAGWESQFEQELRLVVEEVLFWDEKMQSGTMPYRTVQRDCVYCEFWNNCNKQYYY